MRAMTNRTDGPALNGALAGTGALLGVFSLLVSAGLCCWRADAAIASVEVIPYALPFREPYVTARGRLERREMVLLRLRSDDGLVGLGEAVPLSLRGGATLAQVVAELEALGERDALDEATLRRRRPGALARPRAARRSTALLDLRGRQGGGGRLGCRGRRRAGRVQRDPGRRRAGGGRRRGRALGRGRLRAPSS